MSKFLASTLRCALSIERVTMGCSIASPSGIFSITMMRLMRSPAKILRQRVLERHVEARAPGSPWRPERPRSWLSMRRDSWRSVPMMCRPPAFTTWSCSACHSLRSVSMRVFFLVEKFLVRLHEIALLLDAAAKHDVGASAGHVGGDGDHLRPAGLRHDLGLAHVLLRVQNLVRELFLLQHAGEELQVLDRGGADQHRLPAVVAVADVLDERVVFLLGGAIDLVWRSARIIFMCVGTTTVSRP